MSVHILNGPLYRTCEVYIDDLLFHGQNDEDFARNTREIFEICRNKGVILSAKKLVIGMTKVPFVGHEVDSLGLDMSQARIDSTIAFTKPASLKELSSFLGLVNYFRDHLRNHSRHSHHLHDMVAAANKQSTKTITWTEDALHGYEKLKAMVNACPKLYFINSTYKIILYTDASDYAHGAYLCQIRPSTETSEETEEPIRFLSGSFSGAQTRWSTIEKEAFAIYWALKKLDDLLGGIAFTIRTDHRNLLYMNNHGSRKVLQWKLDIQHYNATIEHVQGPLNTPDAFSRLVEKAPNVSIHHIMVLKCSAAQRTLIQKFHVWLCAHNGVERTIALLTQHCPDETSTLHWKNLRHDVRE